MRRPRLRPTPAPGGREVARRGRLLEQDFIRVAEQAAIAAAQTMGRGNRKHSDHVAVEAMRHEMDTLPIHGRVVIGEGERDKAPMLYVGEEVGAQKGDGLPDVDIAVDPLEGTNLCATARRAPSPSSPPPSAAACSTPRRLHGAADRRATARGVITWTLRVENLRNIAKASSARFGLTVVCSTRAPRAADRRHPHAARASA